MGNEDFMIFLEDFDFLNGLEASIVEMKQQIAKLTSGVSLASEDKHSWAWNPEAIRWERAEGAKGEYEKSVDYDGRDFKALLRDLSAHGGKLIREGFFYWLFRNGSTVGRKRRVKDAENKCVTRRMDNP